jgi:hypothetical protein
MDNRELEKTTVQQIVSLHSQIIADLKRSLDSAIRIGHLLSEQKVSLKHGEFGPWIKANLPFKERTARNYMRCYRERDRLKTATVADLKSAYRLLAEPKEDDDTLSRAAKLSLEIQAVLPRLKHEIKEVDSVEDALMIRDEALEYGQKSAEMIIALDAYIGKFSILNDLFDGLDTDYFELTPVGLKVKRKPTEAEILDYVNRFVEIDKFISQNNLSDCFDTGADPKAIKDLLNAEWRA